MKTKLVVLFTSVAIVSGCSEVGAAVNGEVLLDVARVEQMIKDGIKEQGGFFVTVDCPDPLSAKVGESRQCLITDESGTNAFVDVTVQNRNGDVTWQVRQ